MIREPRLIPFKAEHLLGFIHRDGHRMESLTFALQKETHGPAFTAVLDERILGCAGVQLMWQGFGIAWAVFSKELFEFPIWTTKTVRRTFNDIIRAFDLRRIESVVLASSPANARWLHRMGFTREHDGRAMHYTTNGEDVIRYEMLPGDRKK